MLYYKYGMYLVPFTAMLTTGKHFYFNRNKNIIEKKDGEEGNQEQTEERIEPQSDPRGKNSKRVAGGNKAADAR